MMPATIHAAKTWKRILPDCLAIWPVVESAKAFQPDVIQRGEVDQRVSEVLAK